MRTAWESMPRFDSSPGQDHAGVNSRRRGRHKCSQGGPSVEHSAPLGIRTKSPATFAIRQSWRSAPMKGKVSLLIALKTIAFSGRGIVQYPNKNGAPRRCPPGDGGKCANYFTLGEQLAFWLNRRTQRDGKCGVPPLKYLVSLLASPRMRVIDSGCVFREGNLFSESG